MPFLDTTNASRTWCCCSARRRCSRWSAPWSRCLLNTHFASWHLGPW